MSGATSGSGTGRAGSGAHDRSSGPFTALGGGADAVFLVDVAGDTGPLRIEVANEVAQGLLVVEPGGEPAATLDDASCAHLAPLVARVRDAAKRDRTTREQVALQTPDGIRVVVDVQLEPMPSPRARTQRVLAVLRLADIELEHTQRPAQTTGVFRTEIGLGAVFVDDAVLALLGLSHEQALGHGWLDAVHAEDRDAVAAALEVAGSGDDAVHIACRVGPGADERMVRIRAVPVRGDDGVVSGYLGSLEDVTDEDRDREAGSRLAELANVLDEWIAIANPDLVLVYANPATRHGLAIADDASLAGVSFGDLLVPEQGVDIVRQIADEIAASGSWSGELLLRALDGRAVEVVATVAAHRGADGAITHYSVLGRDVTTTREVERALRDSEERFRLIAESSPSGMFFVAEGVINYANQRLADILGEPVERVLDRSFLEFVHPDDLSRVAEGGLVISVQNRVSLVEVRVRRPSGETRWLRAHGAPVIDEQGTNRGFVGSVVDVTEELAARRELEMLGRAVESTRDLVTFHDAEGRMFFANSAARAFIGLAPDDSLPELYPPDFLEGADAYIDEVQATLLNKGQWNGEAVAVGAHNRRMPVSVGVVAHYDERGDLEYYSALTRDLSEHKRTESARRRSETMLRAIVQSSPLAIFALDAGGTIHVWNRASEELFGWSAPEVVGGTPPFVSDVNRDDMQSLLDRVFEGKTVKGHSVQYVRRDGEIVDADVSIAPLRNRSGRVVTAVAVLADVTEQRRATQALVQSEVWFRSLVQNSTDMVLVINADFALTYVSPSACEFAGVDPSSVLYKSPTGVFNFVEDDRDTMSAAMARLRATPGSIERVTFRSIRFDGVVRWIEMTVSNLLDDPAVRGIVANARDITEPFEAQAAVRASEERQGALLSSVNDAITLMDGDGGLLYTSPVAQEMFGGDDGEDGSDGDSVFAMVHPDDLPRALDLWEATRGTPGVSPPAEIRIRRADGGVVHAEIVANNLLDDPSVQGIVMTIRDVTERRRSEVALRDSEARLRDSEARYRAVVEDQVELVCRYAPDTTIRFANRAFASFYGRNPDELIGARLLDLFPESERAEESARLAGFGRGRELQTRDDWEIAADGTRRWYRWTDRAFLDDDGAVVEFQSVGHDVTEEHRATVLMANQADILEQIARGVPLEETLRAIANTVETHFPRLLCGVMLFDPEPNVLRLGAAPHFPRALSNALDEVLVVTGANPCADSVLQRQPVYASDVSALPLAPELQRVAAECDIRAAWSTPVLGSDGRSVLGTVTAYAHDRGQPDPEHRRLFSLVAHLASIAIERKAFEDRLAHESMHDPLTGLPNRLLFLDRLAIAVARGRRTKAGVAVLFLDLDRFKNVNDGLGHDAGDELLIAVARRLESVLRPGDTVARFGGDEFTILCEDLPHASSRERAIEIAERLLSALERPFVMRNAEQFIGVSVGIALTSSGEEAPDELLRDADAAMYHAKEAGRGRVEVFDDTMRARALARHATENALHHAIERGELRLFFQPIVALDSARCIGAEALVRWQHPERGLVLPAEFVPLAEETGLVVALGAWVLEEAAKQAAIWQLQHDGDFSVSINLSARQVAEPDLADRVADVIARTGVRPANLCFEITETVLMEDAEAVMRVIERVRGLGVRFAIDDFGTGYSSLGYLKRFSVDAVKIDRAFVSGLGVDDGDRAIVSAVIGLAHALGLRVVAEGVEEEAQLAELVALGCDEAQGYFFAPPQPADDLRQLVSRTRRWRPPGSPLMGR